MSEHEQQSTVSDHYAGQGAREYFDYQVQTVKRNNWVSKRFFDQHVSSDDAVVDYGCGTGWLLKLLDADTRLGVEPNPNSRRVAAEIGIETVATPGEVGDGSADVVISNHALEHSLDPLAELRQIRRIVRSNGKIVICLPIDDWRRQRTPNPEDPNHHLFTWTPQLFANLLTEAGFETTDARAFSYLQTPPRWSLDKAPRWLFDFAAKLYGIKHGYHQLVVVARPV